MKSQTPYGSRALLFVPAHVVAVVRSGHNVVEGRPQLCLACRKVSACELVGKVALTVQEASRKLSDTPDARTMSYGSFSQSLHLTSCEEETTLQV